MNLSITVSGTGDKELMANMTSGAQAVVHQALAKYDKALPGKVAAINKDPRRR